MENSQRTIRKAMRVLNQKVQEKLGRFKEERDQ